MCRLKIEEEQAKSGGDWLPLSVYKQRGFDTDLIEQKCTDTRIHKIFGKVYRVTIDSLYSATIEKAVRKELFYSKSKGKAAKGSIDDDSEDDEDGQGQDTDTDTDTDSSSSSSSTDKNKKQKRSKAR